MFSITKRLRFPAKIPSLPANRSTSTSTFPVPIDSCSFPPSDRQTLCLFLADRLIKRRLLSATRSVVERIIQRSSLPDAVSVLDFAAFRGLFSDPKSYSSLLCTLVRSGQLHKVERIYTACRGFTDPTCGILRGTTCESVIQAIYQPLQMYSNRCGED